MKKRKIAYIVKMSLKWIILLVPLLTLVVSLIASNTYGELNVFSLSLILDLPINAWYGDLLGAIGLRDLLSNSLWINLLIYPLYVLWVEIFDLIVHIFIVLPKLGHKLLGEKD